MTAEENRKIAEDVLRPCLTEYFLNTLVLAVKTCGWWVDHVESSAFVRWCFDVADKEAPDLSAFEYDEEDK